MFSNNSSFFGVFYQILRETRSERRHRPHPTPLGGGAEIAQYPHAWMQGLLRREEAGENIYRRKAVGSRQWAVDRKYILPTATGFKAPKFIYERK